MLRETVLFCLVFAAQILIVSHFLPKLMLQRMHRALEHYPPSSYPKLYPQPPEHYRVRLILFTWSQRVVVLLGVLIMAGVLFWIDHASFAEDGHVSEAWPAAFGLVQFLPWMMLEISSYRQLKLMRQANISHRRTADLRRRRLFAAVSPLLVAAAAAVALAAMAFDFVVHDLDFSLDRDSTQRALVLLVSNLFLATVGAWTLHGKRLDPHQAPADRMRHTRTQLKSLLFVSMAMSVFIFLQAAEDVVDLAPFEAALTSLYFIALGCLSIGLNLHALKLEDLDLEVYRGDAVNS